MAKKPEFSSIIGCALGVGSVIGAMYFKHINFDVFLNPAATLVIFVGTVATIFNAFPGGNIKNIGKLFGIVFNDTSDGQSNIELIDTFSSLSVKARKEGLLSIEEEVKKIDNRFMRKGLMMVIDGMDEDDITSVLELDIESMEERHATNATIFAQAGTYAPTLGVLGAVFGLIAAMGNINDTEMMAEAIAAAFIATILGIFTGYVLWNPFANKLRIKSKTEASQKRLIIEGILCLHAGESPTKLKERLSALLPATEQEMFDDKSD